MICHYSDVIMSIIASQITGVSIVYSTVCSSADQRKHQSPASLALVRGIHRWRGKCFHLVTSSCFGTNYFKLRNFSVLQTNGFSTVDWGSGPWRFMVACRLNLWKPGTMVISIGMDHLPLVTLLYVSEPINNDNQILWRLWKIIRFNMQSVSFASKTGLVIFVVFLTLSIPVWKR